MARPWGNRLRGGKRRHAATDGHAVSGHAPRGDATAGWGELVQVHDDRAIFQASPVELPDIDIDSL
jgi:hypothetical protein